MKFLLINPFVCDFACYDYWMKPLGLLYLSSLLKRNGHKVELIDCMDRHHPALPEEQDTIYGRGDYYRENCKKPQILSKYPRQYSQYGLSGTRLYDTLQNTRKPDMVVLTSTMTYWYPGVKDVADMVKKIFRDVPLILGGVYATLCEEHAKNNIKADYIMTGNDFKGLFNLIGKNIDEFSQWPAPDYSHYKKVSYAVIRTSIGCPKSCSYCGIKRITEDYKTKSAEKIKEEVDFISNKYKVSDFVFYDDALLENKELIKYLEKAQDLRFHSPNGIEVRKIDKYISGFIKRANFIDPCLSVDIVDEDRMSRAGNKLKKSDIEKAADNLLGAGYKKGEFSAYIIMGLPGQELREVKESIEYIHNLGFKIRIAEYAIVPESIDAEKFDREVIDEPLLHNNSIFPSFPLSSWDEIFKIKNYAINLNNGL